MDDKVVIFDIDGTLSNPTHRLHYKKAKDWDGFYATSIFDPVNEIIADWVAAEALDHEILFLTGRPESIRTATVGWLYDLFGKGFVNAYTQLHMKPINSSHMGQRSVSTYKWKEKWLNEHLALKDKILFVVEDDPRVVEMWRRNNVRVIPVSDGSWEVEKGND